MAATNSAYAAIIDAGSTASRLYIYQWHSEVALGEPLNIRKTFPSTRAEKKTAVAAGGLWSASSFVTYLEPNSLLAGIQHKEKEMETYLTPMIAAGEEFLQKRNVTDVPLYLLATGGMREELDADKRNAILRAAHLVMSDWQNIFSVGRWQTNTRVIPGSVEGLYGWVAQNYGKGVEEQTSGLLELGGASMQMAYKVSDVQVTKERVCLLSGEHRVFTKTWDGFGADSSEESMLAMLLAEAGGENGTAIMKNPCMPVGQVGSPISGTNLTAIGSGEFGSCLRLARNILEEGLTTRDPIPSYLDIASFSKHFYGISNYWYNYQFFAKWGGYDVNHAYDRKAFTDAVTKYCSSNWDQILWAVDDSDRTASNNEHICWSTAWMLMLLHDNKYGFGLEMTQYDTWTSLLRFPTTVDLASRSTWTIGAAALIARHGELSFCPTNGSSRISVMHKTPLKHPLIFCPRRALNLFVSLYPK